MSVSEMVVSLHSIAYFGGFGLKREGIAIWYSGTIALIANQVYNKVKIGGVSRHF